VDWKKLLAELREKGWTQKRVADHLGVSQAFVSDLSRGKTTNISYDLGRGIEHLHEREVLEAVKAA